MLLYPAFWYKSSWPWPWFKVTGIRERQTSAPVISVFKWFEWNLVYCCALQMWWTSYSFCRPFNIQGRESYLHNFVKKKTNKQKNKTFNRHLQTNFFQTWYDDRDHYISCMRNEKKTNRWCPFSGKFKYWLIGWNSVCCHNLLVCWSSW